MKSRSILTRILLSTTAVTAALVASAAMAQDNSAPAANDGSTTKPAKADTAKTNSEKKEGDVVVVVTGIRGSLQSATQIKRKASTFVDSITASDVSALPDVSVSEALGRVPGVSVTRYQYGGASPDFPAAEGSGNLIRGLGFIRSEFNGRDEFSANGGRALDWSSVPPELVGGVDVYKNSTAELIEGGIGGTINLRTLEPFDRKGSYLAISADDTYADLRKKWSPSYSIVGGNRWKTDAGEFGLMASYSDSKLNSGIYDWQQGAPIPRATPGKDEPSGSAEFNGVPASSVVGVIPVFQLRKPQIDRDRTSYYLAGQWKDDNTLATFKYVRVKNHTTTVEHTVEHLPGYGDTTNTQVSNITTAPFSGTVPLCNTGDPGASGTPPYDCNTQIPIGSIMTSGLITSDADHNSGPDGYPVNTLGRGVVDNSLTEDFSLNVKRKLSEHWHLNFDVQFTKASASNVEIWDVGQTHLNVLEKTGLDDPQVTFMEPAQNAYNQNLLMTNNPAAQVTTGMTSAQIAAANALGVYNAALKANESGANVTNTADPNGYNWLAAMDTEHQGTGQLTATRLDLAYDFNDGSWFKTLKFGARYSERGQVNEQNQGNWAGVSPTWGGHGVSLLGALTAPGAVTVDNFANFYNGHVLQGPNTQFVYISSKYLLDLNAFSNLFKTDPVLASTAGYAPHGTSAPMFGPDDISHIKEKTSDLYVQLDFAHDLSNGMSLDGNFGLRYTKTDVASQGALSYHAFSLPSTTCTVNATNTAYGCSHYLPQQFLPGTATYLQQAASQQVVSNHDSHLLPSFNVKWNLNADMLVRFAVSDGLTRPNVQDIRAGQVASANTVTTQWPLGHAAVGVNDGVQSITLASIGLSGGNPLLKPTTARSVDLSYEWYFKGGALTIAGFDKNLHNIIGYGSQQEGSVSLDGTTVPIIYSGQVNTNRAKVSGAEVEYQQFYDQLPGIFSHLGFQGNFSLIDAHVLDPNQNCTAGGGDPCRFGLNNLYGQSKYILNLVGIYQDSKFEGRIAYDWRSRYLVSYGDYMTGNPIFNDAAGFMDASFKYNFDKHLQFRVSLENMLNTKNKASMQVNPQGQMLERYSVVNDRRYTFGLRYLF